MIDQKFREILPQFVAPLLRIYQQFNLTPNHITVMGMLVGFLAALCVAQQWFWLAIVIWWLGRLLDGTDGIYARHTQQSSAFGAYLDIACDMAAYSAMILGFAVAFNALVYTWLIILFFYVLCITTALALGHAEERFGVGKDQNRGMRLGAGLAEGGETGIAYAMFCLLPGEIDWLSKLWVGVLLITVVARTVLAANVLRNR